MLKEKQNIKSISYLIFPAFYGDALSKPGCRTLFPFGPDAFSKPGCRALFLSFFSSMMLLVNPDVGHLTL